MSYRQLKLCCKFYKSVSLICLKAYPKTIMDTFTTNNSNPTPQNNSAPVAGQRKKAPVVGIVVSLVLIAAGVAGGFYWGSQQKTTNNTNTNTGNTTQQPATDQLAAPSFYTLTSEAHPFDLKKADVNKKMVVSFAVPNGFQAVKTDSNNQNRGYEQYFTNKYNDEIGRWAVGYPTSQDSSNSQVSILAIGQEWLKATQNVEGKMLTGIGADINTPAQKAKFLSDLKANTEACAKDKAKGFATKDGSLKVCYEVIDRKTDAILVLKGYGELQGQQMVLVGTIDLASADQAIVQNWVSALSQSTLAIK